MLNYLLRPLPFFFLPLCETWNSWLTSLWCWVYLSFVAVLPQLCFFIWPSPHFFHYHLDTEAVFGVNANPQFSSMKKKGVGVAYCC